MVDSIEQEERARLWYWIEYMGWEFDPETIEQMVQLAVQSRQIQAVIDLVESPAKQEWEIWSVSSVRLERCLDMAEGIGSNPIPTTTKREDKL